MAARGHSYRTPNMLTPFLAFLNFKILSLVNHSKNVTVKVVRGKKGKIKIFPYL